MADPKPIKTIAADHGIGQDPPASTDAILKEKAGGQPSWCTIAQLIPAGGSDGQALTKIDGTDYNLAWETPASGGLEAEDIASGTITARTGAVDFSGGSDGHVWTVQADGSVAFEAPAAGGGGSATITTDLVAASKIYVAGDFPTNAPLYILAEAPDATPIVLTFPPPADFALAATEARILAYVRVANTSAPVSITLAAGSGVRSQTGTAGWDATTTPVYIGASQTLSDEAVVTVMVEGTPRHNLLFVDGIVRASA